MDSFCKSYKLYQMMTMNLGLNKFNFNRKPQIQKINYNWKIMYSWINDNIC